MHRIELTKWKSSMKRHNIIALMIFSIFTTLYGCVLMYQDQQAEAGYAKIETPAKEMH